MKPTAIVRVLSLALVLLGASYGAMAQEGAQEWPDAYGAMAYSPGTGAYGYVYDLGSRSEAESGALAQCAGRTSGGDCKVLLWFKNSCGAIATATNGAYGSGWGESRALAEQNAVTSCSRNASNCQPLAWACTSR